MDLEEAKLYLRVDSTEDDELIESLVQIAERLVKDVARLDDEEFKTENLKIPILYACAYLYEHRENADHKALTLVEHSIRVRSNLHSKP